MCSLKVGLVPGSASPVPWTRLRDQGVGRRLPPLLPQSGQQAVTEEALAFVYTVGVQWSGCSGWAGRRADPSLENQPLSSQSRPGSGPRAPAWRLSLRAGSMGSGSCRPCPAGRIAREPTAPLRGAVSQAVWRALPLAVASLASGRHRALTTGFGLPMTFLAGVTVGLGSGGPAASRRLLCWSSAGSFTVVCSAPRSGEPGEGAAGGEAEGGPERASQTGG